MKLNFWAKLKKPILALAPMAGVTDSAFRLICREQGADVVYTEMVSADGLYHDSKKTLEFLKFQKKERPVVIQLFGKDPTKFAKAARLCQAAGFSGIDINFGCPAKKVAGHGGGVTLMRDLNLCQEIIEATLSGASLPVSVKIRSSINRNSLAKIAQKFSAKKNAKLLAVPRAEVVTALDFVQKMSALPVAAVMVHGRPYEQPFDGEIDWAMIKKVKENFSGLVLANGGIKSPEEAKKLLAQTGADGLGLARGVYGRPWLFKQIDDYLRRGCYDEPSIEQIKKIIWRQAKAALADKGQRGLRELRKHLLWYVAGWPGAKDQRRRLATVDALAELKKTLQGL